MAVDSGEKGGEQGSEQRTGEAVTSAGKPLRGGDVEEQKNCRTAEKKSRPGEFFAEKFMKGGSQRGEESYQAENIRNAFGDISRRQEGEMQAVDAFDEDKRGQHQQ